MKRIGLLMFALALLLAACAAPAEEGPELTETEDPALTETIRGIVERNCK